MSETGDDRADRLSAELRTARQFIGCAAEMAAHIIREIDAGRPQEARKAAAELARIMTEDAGAVIHND